MELPLLSITTASEESLGLRGKAGLALHDPTVIHLESKRPKALIPKNNLETASTTNGSFPKWGHLHPKTPWSLS